MSFSLGSILMSFLQTYSFREEMSVECLLFNRRRLDTEYSDGAGQGGGMQWVREGLTRDCIVAGLLFERKCSFSKFSVCVLPSCQLLPGALTPELPFLGKCSCSRTFLTWLLSTPEWSHVSFPADPALCLPGAGCSQTDL